MGSSYTIYVYFTVSKYSMFSLSRIAFFVARNDNWSDSLAQDPVVFNQVVLNEGGGWNRNVSNYFTVPVSGYYLIFMSAGALPNTRVDMRLYQNNVSNHCSFNTFYNN